LIFELPGQRAGDFVGGHANGLAGIMPGIFDHSPCLVLAQNDANRRVFVCLPYLSVQCRQIKLNLAEKFGFKFANFQFHRHQRPQGGIVFSGLTTGTIGERLWPVGVLDTLIVIFVQCDNAVICFKPLR